jgi:hypothetical protein
MTIIFKYYLNTDFFGNVHASIQIQLKKFTTLGIME